MNVPASWLSWALISVIFATTVPTAETPPVRILTVDETAVTIALPDAANGYYRSSRFVWGGMVTQVLWHGHTYFTELKRPHDPLRHDGASGGAEEFGIDDGGLGYDHAKPGERFAKIGVGALTRIDEKEYLFHSPYPIAEVAPWIVTDEPNALRFVQDYRLNDDWAWHYDIVVRVSADGFALTRHLDNRGLQRIHTDHYNHHMFAIDDQPIDGSWTLRLPPDTIPKRPTPAYHMTDGLLTLTGAITNTLWTDFGWSGDRASTAMTLTHGTSKTAITISTDSAPSKIALYAEKTAICPEPFVAIDLAPGDGKTWTTTYRFAVTP